EKISCTLTKNSILVHYLQKSTMVVFSHDSPYKKINTPARISCAILVFHGNYSTQG
ncbi:MAG: hypothetical protein ACI90V_002323, partial [Bacillariaceae sp.]